MAVRIQHVRPHLVVLSARRDAELCEAIGNQELAVDDQGANRLSVAIGAKMVELDMVQRGDIKAGRIIQIRDRGVAIVVTALGLLLADLRQLRVGVQGLIAVGTE